MATVDGQEPCILYHNALEDATLSVTSGGATLNAGSLANLKDRLTFTTADFTGFSGSTLIIQADAAGFASETFSTVESPLATNWTNVGDEALQVVSGGYATDASQTALTAGTTERHYIADNATPSGGVATVQCDVQFSSTSSPSNIAGVSVRHSGSTSFIAAVLTNTGRVDLIYDTGSGSQSFDSGGKAYSISAATDYTIKLVVGPGTAKVYVDGTLEISSTFTPGTEVAAGFVPDQVGIYQYASTPASNTAQWDSFSGGEGIDGDTLAITGQLFQGATGANVGGTYTLQVEYTDDGGSTWTEPTYKGWSTTPKIGCDATIILRWDDTTGPHDAYRFTWTDVSLTPTGDVKLGAICLGKRLTVGEYMASGFDPSQVGLKSEGNRNVDGQYVGGVVMNASQDISLDFSRAGVAATEFHDVDQDDIGDGRRYPSIQHFLKTCWSVGKPFWFQYWVWSSVAGLHCHEGSFYGWPSKRARTSAPYISPARRRWRFDFEVLAEGYVGDFPLNDP